MDVAPDHEGKVFVAGHTVGLFLARYSGDGVLSWKKDFTGTSTDNRINRIAVDHNGHVFIAGYITGEVDFGGGPLVSAGLKDIFLAKFDGDGTHLWSQRFGNEYDDEARGVAVDNAGNVVITGDFGKAVDFGGGSLVNPDQWGKPDAYLARFDGEGKHLWSKRFGSFYEEWGRSVCIDPAGNVIATGDFRSSVDFGAGEIAGGDFYDVFLIKYSSDGNHVWSKGLRGPDTDLGFSVAADLQGNVVIMGSFIERIDLDGLELDVQEYRRKLFLASYSGNGDLGWGRLLNSSHEMYRSGMDIDLNGRVLITGTAYCKVDFGSGPYGTCDETYMFVAKFSNLGQSIWSKGIPAGGQASRGFGIGADSEGFVYATGGHGSNAILTKYEP